jgi:hypothetical protein
MRRLLIAGRRADSIHEPLEPSCHLLKLETLCFIVMPSGSRPQGFERCPAHALRLDTRLCAEDTARA